MMPQEQFPVRPCVTAYLPWEKKSGLWYFEKEFPFFSPFGNGVIEVGFETDFGSVPKWARSFVDDDDPRALCPFLRHDKRYKEAKGERIEADKELYEGCITCGMSRLKAWLVYQAVRIGGASHWKPDSP